MSLLLKRSLGLLWYAFFILNFCVSMVLLYPFFYIFLSRKAWYPYAMTLKRIWARLIIYPTGVFLNVKYQKPLPKNEAYVFCPNHASYLDVILSYILIPQYFHYVGKYELSKIPLFGIFFNREMDIAVNRSSIRAAQRAIDRAASDLSKGISIAMYPEGTISQNPPQLGNFKNGPFKLAIEQQVSIVPITFLNNWLILPEQNIMKRGARPGMTRVIVHEPISTKGMTLENLEELKKATRIVLESTLNNEYRS